MIHYWSEDRATGDLGSASCSLHMVPQLVCPEGLNGHLMDSLVFLQLMSISHHLQVPLPEESFQETPEDHPPVRWPGLVTEGKASGRSLETRLVSSFLGCPGNLHHAATQEPTSDPHCLSHQVSVLFPLWLMASNFQHQGAPTPAE